MIVDRGNGCDVCFLGLRNPEGDSTICRPNPRVTSPQARRPAGAPTGKIQVRDQLQGYMIFIEVSPFASRDGALPPPKFGCRALQSATSCGPICGNGLLDGRGGAAPCMIGAMQSTSSPEPMLTPPCTKPACRQAAVICPQGSGGVVWANATAGNAMRSAQTVALTQRRLPDILPRIEMHSMSSSANITRGLAPRRFRRPLDRISLAILRGMHEANAVWRHRNA